ncbi:MAG: ABC transporter permease [Bacteroidales bacterium]|nr:ABC transporter permease [Bacteroidales bacterium]
MNPWTIIIRPHRRLLDIDLRELWEYRDLYWMYVRRDVTVAYKQTVLGPLWYLLQPVLTTLMLMFVFGGIAGISTEGLPQPLFYLSGLLIWNYFSCVLTDTSQCLIKNAHLLGKVYFPRIVIPMSIATSNLLKVGIQALLLMGLILYYMVASGLNPVILSWRLALAPIIILATGLLAMGCGMIIAALTSKYRDLALLVSFGIQLLMLASPVAYPLSAMPERWQPYALLNPLASMIEELRYSLYGMGSADIGWIFYSAIFVLVALAVGIIVFAKAERNFIDHA